MPLRKNGIFIRTIVAAAIGAAAFAMPSAALANCAEQPTKQAFAKFGDTADYSIAPAGDFEAAGWQLLNGAKITTGNETAGITTGSKSLFLPRTGIAISPEFCVSNAHPTFRFMTKSNFWYSTYQALVLYRDTEGTLTQAQFVSSDDTKIFPGSWKPSAISPLATKIPLLASGAAQTASVQILLRAGEGSTQFDSVMVDPYRRG